MTSIPESEPAREPAKRVSIWEDFADIFFEPANVFERRRNGPFAVVFVILTIVIGALSWAWMGALEPVFIDQFTDALAQIQAQQPGMTADQMAGMRSMMLISTKVAGILTVPVIVLLTGFAIWLIGKLFDSTAPFKTALMIATFAQFPRVLKLVVELVQAMVFDPSRLVTLYSVSLSPARFLHPDTASAAMLAITGRFDLFILWMTVLIGIGVYVAGRVSKRNAAVIAGLAWLLGGLFVVFGAMRQA